LPVPGFTTTWYRLFVFYFAATQLTKYIRNGYRCYAVIRKHGSAYDEGTGTRLDYLVNRADKKIEGPLGKKIARKSRNSRRVRGGGMPVGTEGMVTKGTNWRGTGTKYKRSKDAFAVTSIALSLGHLGARLLKLTAQQSNRESWYPHYD